jgi:hypothetical protein
MKSRKELVADYKQMKFPMGVYQIRNLANGKIYLGSSLNLNAIWNRERLQLDMGSHPNAELQHDWKATGEAGFAYEILSEIEQKEGDTIDYRKEIKQLEALFLEELKPFGARGYHFEKKA